MRDIKNKNSKNIIIILSALLIIFITINTIPFKSNTSWNQTREDSTKSKTETPHLSFENVWMVNGTVISTAINNQAYTQITSDGAGGAIITWRDSRSGTNDDIYAQRVNSSG
ncbi:unnamed protein product, partial [marine sediment metagenome]